MHVGGNEVKLNHALCTLKMASTILFLLANLLEKYQHSFVGLSCLLFLVYSADLAPF